MKYFRPVWRYKVNASATWLTGARGGAMATDDEFLQRMMEDAGKKDSEEYKQAATEAGTMQRQAALLVAQRNLQQAESALASR